MLKNKYLLSLFFVFVYVNSIAQLLTYDSLKTVILAENPELEMYRYNAQALDAMAEGATAWEAPQIGMGLFMTPYNATYWKPKTMGVDGADMTSSGMGNFMIQGRQMIPNPAKLNANKKYMQAMSTVEVESQNAAANNLLYHAKTNFYEIQIADRKLAILNESKKTLDIIIELGEGKVAYNKISIASIYKAKSQRAMLQNEIAMLEADRIQRTHVLNNLMNCKDKTSYTIDTQFVIKNYDKELIDTTKIKNNRSDLLALDQEIQVALLKQKTEQVKSNPDFGIEFGHMSAFGNNPNLFTLMGMVTIPIAPWSSKMYKANAVAYNHKIKSYQSQKESIINEAINTLYSLKNKISSAKNQIGLYDTMILPSLKKSYDFALLAYTQNTGDLFEALDARMNLQMAQIQYQETLLNLLTLQAEYEKQLQIY